MATLDPDARVSPADVKEIIETDLADTALHVFINTAHNLVQDALVSTSAGLSNARLTDIELWLSAHYLAVGMERQVQSERVGDEWQATYEGKTDMGLNSTRYGQMALGLDTSGKLATLGKQRARFKVFTA